MRGHNLSIKQISLLWDEEDEMILYGQFLDDFYREDAYTEKSKLISEEPLYSEKHKIFLCLLAGSAEKLAKDNMLPIPNWTNDTKYKLKEAYFAFDTENSDFQAYLIQTTPIEYKKRNLMVGNTILERC